MGWFSRLFRSRGEAQAERAEVEGRFEDAARIYAELGARAEAFRVLVRAAESARDFHERRQFYTRAYAVARTEEAQNVARKGLALCALAEFDMTPPRNDSQRARLLEAAKDLEKYGSFREAARAFKILGEKEGVERVMVLAGDIEGYEREVGADEAAERNRLRRRSAVESGETLWRSGDRAGALAALEGWLRTTPGDEEARLLLDERRALLCTPAKVEAKVGELVLAVVGRFPVTLGREADVSLRGAGVSREHAMIERAADGTLTVRDNGSRNGTTLEGLPLAGTVALAEGQLIGLGSDLVLKVKERTRHATVLEVDRGMDRGRRVALLMGPWKFTLGHLRFDDAQRLVLEPDGAVELNGQRVVMPIVLARGDRVHGAGTVLELLR